MGRLDIKGFDDNLLQELRSFLVQYYGSLWGNLKRFVEEAVREKLEREKQKLQQRSIEDLRAKIKKKHIRLLLWLYEQDEVYSTDIIQYIKFSIGVDRRTIKKYYDFVVVNGFVEEIRFISPPKRGDSFPVILYRVRKRDIAGFLKRHGIQVEEEDKNPKIKEIREIQIKKRGINIETTETGEERISMREVVAYARELREYGYSLEEIKDRLSELGFDYSERRLRSLIRKSLSSV